MTTTVSNVIRSPPSTPGAPEETPAAHAEAGFRPPGPERCGLWGRFARLPPTLRVTTRRFSVPC